MPSPTTPSRSPRPPGIEPEWAGAWRAHQANPTLATSDQLLNHLKPTIETGISAYGGPKPSPQIRARAKRITIDAIRTYDPTKSSLKSHTFNHLQGLQRYVAKAQQLVDVPERVAIMHNQLHAAESELTENLGRPPSTSELADHVGLPPKRIAKIRQYRPGFSESQLQANTDADGNDNPNDAIAVERGDTASARAEFLMPDLDPTDQLILEHSLGMHGRPRLGGTAVAKALKLSPGAISQRASRIQKMLDQLDDIGGF